MIINEVGRGSTGVVYLSHDPYYGRDVAIKVYNIDSERRRGPQAHRAQDVPLRSAHGRHAAASATSCRSTMRARRTATATSSRSTCTARARWPPTAARTTCCGSTTWSRSSTSAARALHYAHTPRRHPSRHQALQHHAHAGQRRAHHRLRHRAGADSEISRIEGIAGSPSYMSPEQVQSIELTNRSDLYSLGAVMYELLTGTRPFRAGNLQKLLHQIVFATPPPIHTLRPEIPEELENVTAMALQKDPEKRYKTGLDFAAELTRVHQKLREPYNRIDQQEQFGAAAQAQVLPRVLPQRDLGGAAREQLAGLRRRRGDRQGRGDGRPLLHHRAGAASASQRLRHGASAPSTPATASARRATCAAPSARRPSAPRAR